MALPIERGGSPPEDDAPECGCGCCEMCGWPLDYLIGQVAGWRVPLWLVDAWVAGAAEEVCDG